MSLKGLRMLSDDKYIIPIMHCFDDNYVIPASVSFLSMLENANPRYFYKLYVLHTDISEKNQNTLNSIVSKFNNADLQFIDMNNKFDDEFEAMKNKAHYSKEVLYKLLAPTIFPQYEQIIITDVDVVFCGDIAEIYIICNDNYGGGGAIILLAPVIILRTIIHLLKSPTNMKRNFLARKLENYSSAEGFYI